jgi:glucose-1-phosphate thymidylyltransferase
MTMPGAIDKAVILARGLGTRMRREDASATLNAEQSEAADAGVKAMISVGRPFLDYVLSSLADAGFSHACLVIGPEHAAIRDYYTGVHCSRIQVDFAVQAAALGTANAVLAAEEFAGEDEFVTINADNYYPADALLAIQRLGKPGAVLFPSDTLARSSNIPSQRISDFAGATVGEHGFLVHIEEKPRADNHGECLVSMNCWRFNRAVFTFCREVPLSERGEYELPMAVNLAIARGLRMKVAISHEGVLDLSRRSDIAAVATRLKGVQVKL